MRKFSERFSLWAIAILGVLAGADSVSAQPAAPMPMQEESPLLIEPESPEEAIEAAVLMQRLARPGLAKRYITQFLNANPDEATLLKIRDKYGPAIFLKMATDRDLQPESKTLYDKITEAFRKRAASPERIAKLIQDLSGGPRERAVAISSLRSAGPVVVPTMLQQAGAAKAGQRTAIILGLVQMGRQVIPPLLGALESPNNEIRAAAIEVLGYVGTKDVVPYLWRSAFGPNERPDVSETARQALTRLLKPEGRRTIQITPFGAPARLKQAALEHFRYAYPWLLKEGQETVAIWTWDPQNQTVAQTEMTPKAASLYRGAELARDALALSPEDEEIQALFLGFALANSLERAGWNAPLPTGRGTALQLALQSGAELVSDTLHLAIENGNVLAAVASLQALSQIASRTQLYGTSADRSPILAALNYPDPRVQFAAAVTVLQLDPDREFSGSGRVAEILTRALGDSGGPAVLVIDPNPERANNVAGMFQQLKYRGQPITRLTGQQGFHAAVQRNDVELVAIQANVTGWDLSQTLANFRADARTASLPILIYGPDWAEAGVQGILKRTPLTGFFVESVTLDYFREQVEPFLNGLKSEPLSAEERAAQASAAAYWFAHIASSHRTDIFDITPAEQALSESIENPDIAGNAIQALAAIPTKTVQRRLEAVAVNAVYPIPFRELAAIQLAFHIQRHGMLLTSDQVREVRAAVISADNSQLASALASVVGSFKPTPRTVGTRLQQFPIQSPLAK